MAKNLVKSSQARFISGISDYNKESMLPDSFAFGRSIDHRSDPRKLTILPRTVKESASTYQDLPKWLTQRSTVSYIYDASGNLYERSSAGVHTLIRSTPQSHGNGLAYYGEDDFVYYAGDKAIGRYGQFSAGSPVFSDDFLTSEGGVPTNTASLDLEAGSSEYLNVADAAALSITGDIAMEIYFKPETLPAVGSSMTLLSKWTEASNQRSYRFDIFGISGYFGDGSGGALTVSSNTTQAPIDSSAAGTVDTYTLSATNASFAPGQVVLIMQMRGTGAGTYQRTKIASYTAGTITLEDTLNFSYSSTGSSKAQVIVFPQYTNVTVNSGITWSAKAWDGTVGGVLLFLANGTVSIVGTISASEKGFRGGAGQGLNADGQSGEGTGGDRSISGSSNGNGAGGPTKGSDPNHSGGGSGGGHAAVGTSGGNDGGVPGVVGQIAGTADLTTMVMGGAGSSGANNSNPAASNPTNGGTGGGIIFAAGVTFTVTGAIISAGGNGVNGGADAGCGGGAAGGSILIKAQTATLGTNLITAPGGSGGVHSGSGATGGAGSVGRIHLDYLTSYTGTTTPTITVQQDNTLVTTTTYQLRLSLSSNGTNEEFLTKNADITTGQWYHCAVSWDASDAQAEFFLNAVSLGVSTGAFTSIYNSTAVYTLGAYLNGSSAASGIIDGKVDEDRLWNTERTAAQIFSNKDVELIGNEAGLVAYHTLDNSLSDVAAGAFNWTHSGTPTYSTDVPFFAPTTRLDIDQEDTATSQTYALGTTIDEGASHRQTFAPSKDPQKSISVNVSAKGTNCDWTLTVHDALNRTVASKTLTNAQLPTSGVVEFIFDTTWRPVLGANYHFHLTATNTTGTPAIVSGTSNNLETGQFKSYYQFLVTDSEWHPLMHFANLLAIGNERYLAVWDASSFNPHRLIFPSGHRVRALGFFGPYLAIGCMLGSTISERDQGRIFFWDGYSRTYNDVIDVPEGAINAMVGTAGELHFFAGYQGDYMIYDGGRRARKIKRIPKITKDKEIEVYPGAMSMWQTLMRFGVAGSSDSEEVEKGVYSYGKLNESYPDSLSYDYPISTGNRLSTVTIGMVAAVGKKLLIGWKDGVSSGVDVVDPAGLPYPTATIELLITDEGGIWKEKIISKLRADFDVLRDGEEIDIKFRLNREDDWTVLSSSTTTGDTDNLAVGILRADIQEGRHREYQVAVDLRADETSPALLGITPEEDLNTEEQFL